MLLVNLCSMCFPSNVFKLIEYSWNTFTSSISDASISEFGDPSTKKKGGYKLTVSKLNNVFFQNIPIDCFESVELSSTVGFTAESKLTERTPSCCGLFSCVGVGICTQYVETKS